MTRTATLPSIYDSIDFSTIRPSSWSAYDISSLVEGVFTRRLLTDELMNYYSDPDRKLKTIWSHVREFPMESCRVGLGGVDDSYYCKMHTFRENQDTDCWRSLTGVVNPDGERWWFVQTDFDSDDLSEFQSRLIASIESEIWVAE